MNCEGRPFIWGLSRVWTTSSGWDNTVAALYLLWKLGGFGLRLVLVLG